jgi:hypothetical protein
MSSFGRCFLLTLLLWMPARISSAQWPDHLSSCLSTGGIPRCHGLAGWTTSADCPEFRIFTSVVGPIVWGPLLCTGAISVEVETFSNYQTSWLPIYVEVVPLNSAWEPVCGNIPGYVVLVAFGDMFSPCGSWTRTIGPVDITSKVPVGSLYGIRIYVLHGEFGHWESPALDCIRVTSHPEVAVVSMGSWGQVKQLFK